MSEIRIKDLPETLDVDIGDYVAVDNEDDGVRRYNLKHLVSSTSAPEFVIHVDSSFNSDKTFLEVSEAIANGYVPVVIYDTRYYTLTKANDAKMTFSVVDSYTPATIMEVVLHNGSGTSVETTTITSSSINNWSDVPGDKITDALNNLASNITYAVNDIGTVQDNVDSLDDRVTTLENEGCSSGDGLTQTEKNLILTLFSKAAYLDDADIAYDQLEALWATSEKTITYNLTDVASSNNATTIESGSGYATALSTRQGYSLNNVTVTMGGVDVTSNYYSSGSITIPRVTGDIVITATAVLSVTSITATYTQSGTVYDTDTLDSLKSDLVVTATYPDSSTAVVDSADYNLSGTLTEGTSTVTVAYGGKTATFNVTVSHLTITAINLPYGAYVDTEYVPTSLQHKYLIGVQYLDPNYAYANTLRPFAGMNRLPAQTTGKEEYWHIYFRNGTGNTTPQNSQSINFEYSAYKNPQVYSIQRRTANGDTSATVDNLTKTPFYFFVTDGESKIRANEELTENLNTGSFASTDSADTFSATTAEAPIDSFYIGKVHQAGSRTIAEFEGGVKIFCFKVWDENDNLLVDMHPAMSGSAIGMYDSVRAMFCEAQGTGAYLS